MSFVRGDESTVKKARRARLLGRIEEANYWIDWYSTKRSQWAKDKLAEAKKARDKDMKKLKDLT